MKTNMNRRRFLHQAAWSVSGLAAAQYLAAPNLLEAANAGDKLRCVVIGCGGRGMNHLEAVIREKTLAELVGIVDADEKQHAKVKAWLKKKELNPDAVQAFTDYRRMFEKIGKEIDAVFIATPNHHHAPPALMAMKAGKHVYCEKPLCHTVSEARELAAAARQCKVATQMGNQGHCEEGYRRLVEYIQAGVIGKVTETYSWTDRANGGIGPRPAVEPVPAGLHWDEWIGPAPYRDFHSDLHPHEWHGWHDFGNGSLGNMGCHVLDGVYWALNLEHPLSIEMEEIRGGSEERFPTGSRLRWDFPARGGQPAVKVFWYEGLKKEASGEGKGNLRQANASNQNLPPLLVEMRNKFAEDEFESNGSLYVGDKGIIYTGTYGGRMHILPWEKMRETPAPAKTLPRTKNIMLDFLEAARDGRTNTAAGFEYGARLTEFTLLGNLAQCAGVNQKVEWDGPGMQVTNLKDLNRWVKQEYRPGWKA